jgi:hypothetical protein
MKVLAIYAINEHLAGLMIEAQEARLAKLNRQQPSTARRLSDALRSAAARIRAGSDAAAAPA